jgi:hypothetical protein
MKINNLGEFAQTWNPSIWELQVGILRIKSQHGLQRESLSQKTRFGDASQW